MSDIHPYAAQLAAKVAQRSNRSVKIKCRTLLKGFGCYRRTSRIVSSTHAYLGACGLVSDISTDFPTSLDDRVIVSLAGSVPPSQTTQRQPWAATTKPMDIVEVAVAATVIVTTENSLGSGFIVHPGGLVVTARHVVNNEDGLSHRTVRVQLANHEAVDGIVFRSHRRLDFALIWLLTDTPLPAVPMADPKTLRFGQRVFAVGSPFGLRNTVSAGVVSNPCQQFNLVECIQTDTSIDHGNSGGPLVCDYGAVGVATWGWGNVDSAKFAVPIDYMMEDIKEAINRGRDQCLSAVYCPACGYADHETPTWYCRNCGVQLSRALPEQGADESREEGR